MNAEKVSIKPIISRDNSDINRIDTDSENNTNNDKKTKKTSKTRKEKIIMALKSWKFWRYNLISLTSNPVSDMIFSLCRSIGEAYQIDQNAIQLLGTLSFIFEFVFSFIFGVLCDYVNFRVLMFISNIIGSIVGFMYYHSFHYSIFFVILNLLLSIQSAAYYSLKDFHLMQVFGTEIYIDLSGVVCLTTGICCIVLTFITYLIETIIEDKDKVYIIIFPILGIINFIGVILGFFEDDKPFDYGE